MKKTQRVELTEICVNVYLNSLSMHIKEMINFYNDYLSNHQSPDMPPNTPINKRIIWNKARIRECIRETYRYYYFLCNEYIFSELNNREIDFEYFTNVYYSSLGEDNDVKQQIDRKTINPEFYKKIEHYYDFEKRPLMEPVYEIISPHIYNSELMKIEGLKPTVLKGMICFFGSIFLHLNCLPEEPDSNIVQEKYIKGFSYQKQSYAGQFKQLFKLMVNNTIDQTNEIIINAKTYHSMIK